MRFLYRFVGRPVYSTDRGAVIGRGSHTDKVQMLRFFHPGTSCVASLYAPTIFPPASVVVYKRTNTGNEVSVCIGVSAPVGASCGSDRSASWYNHPERETARAKGNEWERLQLKRRGKLSRFPGSKTTETQVVGAAPPTTVSMRGAVSVLHSRSASPKKGVGMMRLPRVVR